MRADRLLSIVLLLQAHHSLTAGELAERLEVSGRTIYRDMEALGIAGIPVVAERGNGGGWSLAANYRTSLAGLNEAEIQALFLSQPLRQLSDLGLGKASEVALLKLRAALPPMYRPDAEFARQRIHIDGASWRKSKEAVPFLLTLQEAIWQGCKVRMAYERSDEKTVERLIDPLGLVAKGSVWYLVAAVEGELRTYRVSRVKSAEIMEQPSVRPPDFELAEFWEQSSAEFRAALPRYPVLVRATPDTVLRMRYARGWGQIVRVDPPDADGWQTVAALCEEIEDACEYVLGFGPGIEVIEPPELRGIIAQLAQGIVEVYAKDKTR